MRYNIKTKLTSLVLALVVILSILTGCKPIIDLDDIESTAQLMAAYILSREGESDA